MLSKFAKQSCVIVQPLCCSEDEEDEVISNEDDGGYRIVFMVREGFCFMALTFNYLSVAAALRLTCTITDRDRRYTTIENN